jgi:hypothetical protein
MGSLISIFVKFIKLLKSVEVWWRKENPRLLLGLKCINIQTAASTRL